MEGRIDQAKVAEGPVAADGAKVCSLALDRSSSSSICSKHSAAAADRRAMKNRELQAPTVMVQVSARHDEVTKVCGPTSCNPCVALDIPVRDPVRFVAYQTADYGRFRDHARGRHNRYTSCGLCGSPAIGFWLRRCEAAAEGLLCVGLASSCTENGQPVVLCICGRAFR